MEYLIPSLTFLIGLGAALVFQYFQSKEVLKQTLYKEKLMAYKHIIIALWDLTIKTNREAEVYLMNLTNIQKVISINTFILPDKIVNKVHKISVSAY